VTIIDFGKNIWKYTTPPELWDQLAIDEQPCLVQQALQQDMKRPAGLRSGAVSISCPCPKCNPICM